MTSPKVIYENSALIGVLISAAEVYKKECYGMLLGFKKKGRYEIAEAVACQTASRGYSEVTISAANVERLNYILDAVPKYTLLGDFHSHPAYGTEMGRVQMSDEDCDDADLGKLQAIVAVNPASRRVRWRINSDYTISGTLGGYHFKIATYLMQAGRCRSRPFRLPVSVPMIK